MATTTNITTTYAGEKAQRWYSAALLSSNSLQNGAIEVMPNVKFKKVLRRASLTDFIKDQTCDFTDEGTLTLDERVLQPESFQVNLKLCKNDYRDTWDAIEMGYSAHDNLPPSFADYLLAYTAARIAESNESYIWSGTTATSGQFDGFETIFTNQSEQPSGQELAGTTVTSSNVIAQLESVLDAVPNAVYSREDFSILIPIGIAKHYISAQAALGYRDLFHDGKTAMNFQGVPLITCNGMTDDVMFATYRENLVFGTGVLADHSEVKLIDTSDTLGDENVRIVARYTAGVQVVHPADVVTYGISNSGN